MNDEKMLTQLGKNIKKIREEVNLSKTQLSKKAGIDRGYLSRIEKGQRNPTLGYIIKISKGLKIPLSNFVKNI